LSLSFKPIRPLLQTGTNAASRWFSYIGLGIGVLLLLCSIQMYINTQRLLGKDNIRKEGFDFISITKTVTNETMGQPEKNLFRPAEVEEIRSKPFVEDVAPLVSNQFRAQLSGGDILPFRTDFLLESVENKFIDTVPPNFTWQEGQRNVPIIISSDFLEIYNVFAPAQGLPQVSSETASNIPAQISVAGNDATAVFNAHIVAFSDRINSVLVPKSFLDWANQKYGEQAATGYTRLYLKMADANNTDFLSFIDSKNYKVNKDRIKFGRTKQTLQGIFSGLGIFGLLVVIMALMLFSFYLQLVIARSRDSLQLLLMLGYSPDWLGKNVSRQFIPVYILVVLSALGITQLMQWLFHHYVMYDRPELDTVVHWSVIATAIFLAILSIITNFSMVRKLLYRLY
jgi:hypothetical protein